MGTVECKTKSCEDGMAKTGETTNDDFCIKCEAVVLKKEGCPALSGSLDWDTMRTKKLAVVETNSGLEAAKREISRESNIRDEMKEQGLERPFLLLCSMAPEMRNVVACSLGFSLYSCRKPLFSTVFWLGICRHSSGLCQLWERICPSLCLPLCVPLSPFLSRPFLSSACLVLSLSLLVQLR